MLAATPHDLWLRVWHRVYTCRPSISALVPSVPLLVELISTVTTPAALAQQHPSPCWYPFMLPVAARTLDCSVLSHDNARSGFPVSFRRFLVPVPVLSCACSCRCPVHQACVAAAITVSILKRLRYLLRQLILHFPKPPHPHSRTAQSSIFYLSPVHSRFSYHLLICS